MMSKPKAKGNKTSFNNKGENETTAYTKKYNQLVQIQLLLWSTLSTNVACSRLSNSADIAKTRSRKNRMHMMGKMGQWQCISDLRTLLSRSLRQATTK